MNTEGIDLFVRILVFVKILSQGRRKKGQEISILRSAIDKLIALENPKYVKVSKEAQRKYE